MTKRLALLVSLVLLLTLWAYVSQQGTIVCGFTA
jgi:hypothetical protein